MLLRAALVASAILLVVPSAAWAGETESRSLFNEGRQLRTAGKCTEAIELFRRALESHPDGLGALRNIAECEEELGKFASARRSWWDLRLAALQSSEPKYQGWAEEAEAAHKALAEKIARVTVTTNRVDVSITVGGRPLDPRLIGTELEMDTGSTEFSLRDGTVIPPTQTLDLQQGKKYTVRLDSQATGEVKPPDDKKDPIGGPKPLEEPGVDPFLVTGIASAGVTGLAVIGLGVSLALRADSLSYFEENCSPSPEDCRELTGDPAAAADAESQGQTTSTMVNVFAIVGGIAAASTATFFILSATNDDAPTTQPQVSFSIVPTGGSFHVRF